jgi:hypothetical protein
MKCPVCKGKGCLPEPRKIERDRAQERYAMAKEPTATAFVRSLTF